MVEQTGGAPARANSLALRLFGWLMLFGAGLLFLALAAFLQLQAGPAGFLVPGTEGRHAVAGSVVPVLATGSAILATLGAASFVVERRWPARPLHLRSNPSGRVWRPLVILVGGLALLSVALLRR